MATLRFNHFKKTSNLNELNRISDFLDGKNLKDLKDIKKFKETKKLSKNITNKERYYNDAGVTYDYISVLRRSGQFDLAQKPNVFGNQFVQIPAWANPRRVELTSSALIAPVVLYNCMPGFRRASLFLETDKQSSDRTTGPIRARTGTPQQTHRGRRITHSLVHGAPTKAVRAHVTRTESVNNAASRPCPCSWSRAQRAHQRSP